MSPPDARQRPRRSAAQIVAGQVDTQKGSNTPPHGAALGWFRAQGAEPVLAGYVVGHHLERGLPRLVSVVVERLAVLTLEHLHRIPLDDQPLHIRNLGRDLIDLADILDGEQVAA